MGADERSVLVLEYRFDDTEQIRLDKNQLGTERVYDRLLWARKNTGELRCKIFL